MFCVSFEFSWFFVMFSLSQTIYLIQPCRSHFNYFGFSGCYSLSSVNKQVHLQPSRFVFLIRILWMYVLVDLFFNGQFFVISCKLFLEPLLIVTLRDMSLSGTQQQRLALAYFNKKKRILWAICGDSQFLGLAAGYFSYASMGDAF